jgi:hypothetical protein
MIKIAAAAVILLSSSVAFAGQGGVANFGSINQVVTGIEGSIVIQQAQISQNAGANSRNWAGVRQYVTNISGNSLIIQGATINNTSIGSSPSFHDGY